MDISNTPPCAEPGIVEQAARWIGRLQEGAGTAERAAFAAWLRASPQHVREFLLQSAMDKETGELDLHAFDVEALLARAGENVVPLAPAGHAPITGSTPPERKSVAQRYGSPFPRAAAAIVAGLLLATGTWWMSLGPGSWQKYATGIAEQRTIQLEDGSVVELGPMSRVDVKLSAREREVLLRSGEASFRVDGDAARPFRVDAGRSTVEVLGTRFTVNRRAESVTVSVVEGRVAVDDRILEAGTELRISSPGKASERSLSAEASSGDSHRRSFTFSGDTLADIAEDFNRYNRSPRLVIEGDALRARQFSGVFDAHDPASLVSYLASDRHLEFERDGEDLLIRERPALP